MHLFLEEYSMVLEAKQPPMPEDAKAHLDAANKHKVGDVEYHENMAKHLDAMAAHHKTKGMLGAAKAHAASSNAQEHRDIIKRMKK